MTREDIIRMAREAMGHTSIEPNEKVTFYVSYNNGIDADGFCDSVETFIERFANLVAAAEREACAKVVEIEEARVFELRDKLEEAPAPYLTGKSIACIQIAAAIRAKGQE